MLYAWEVLSACEPGRSNNRRTRSELPFIIEYMYLTRQSISKNTLSKTRSFNHFLQPDQPCSCFTRTICDSENSVRPELLSIQRSSTTLLDESNEQYPIIEPTHHHPLQLKISIKSNNTQMIVILPNYIRPPSARRIYTQAKAEAVRTLRS